jgi:hypothetical protein
MEIGLIYVIVLLSIFVLLNIVATFVVWNTYFEIKERRTYQTIFIWLVPFIGSFMAIYINREDYFMAKHKRQIGNGTSISNSDATSMGYHSSDGGR